MKYLFDTDILINELRGKKRLNDPQAKTGIYVSIITLGELLYGAYKSTNKEKSLNIVDEFFNEFEIEVLPLDHEVINTFAKIKADLELKGKRLEDFDLLIAATALVFDLTLITNNKKHFQRIPKIKFL